MKSISLPNGVKSVGDKAFAWCSSLTTVYMPSSVDEIGEHAFFECRKLTSIFVPKGTLEKFKKLFIPWYHLYLKEL